LVYGHKERSEACQLTKGEFAQFHIHHEEAGQGRKPGTISIHEVIAEAAGEHEDEVPAMKNFSGSKTTSVLLEGSVSRHNIYLEYQKFERSVTTLLATMLSKNTCQQLIVLLKEQHQKVENVKSADTTHSVGGTKKKTGDGSNSAKLQVVTIKDLLELLGSMSVEIPREVQEVTTMIQSLKNFASYENFAYHISLLRQFSRIHTGGGVADADDDDDEKISSVHGSNVWKTLNKKKNHLGSSGHGKDPDSSIKSTNSNSRKGMGMRRVATATGALSSMQ